MKKLFKIFAAVFVVVVILVAAVVIFALAAVDKAAKYAIEQGGTYALGVETTIDKADVQITAQAVELDGLLVANPAGFESHFLSLGHAGVSLNWDTVRTQVIELPTLEIHDLDMRLLKNKEGSNYKVILENLKKFESDEADPPTGGDPAEEGLKFVVSNVDIRNVSVRLELTPVGGDLTAIDVDLDEIALKNIGTAGDPVAAGDIIGIIVKAVLSAAINKSGDLFPKEMLGELENGLAGLQSLGDSGVTMMMDVGGQLTDVSGELGKGLGEAAGNLGEGAGKSVDDIGKGLGDVIKNPFGKKGKDDDGG